MAYPYESEQCLPFLIRSRAHAKKVSDRNALRKQKRLDKKPVVRETLSPKDDYEKALKIQEQALVIVFDKFFKGVHYLHQSYNPVRGEMLKLRLVSKSFKNVVDKYLFEKPVIEQYFEGNFESGFRFNLLQPRCYWTKEFRVLKFETVQQIKLALRVFSENSAKKCFVRELVVDEKKIHHYDSDTLERFRTALTKFLELSGDSFWSFSYYRHIYHNDDGLRSMPTMVKLMPALKILKIGTSHECYFKHEMEAFMLRMTEVIFSTLPALRYHGLEKSECGFVRPRFTFVPRSSNLEAVSIINYPNLDLLMEVRWPLKKLTLSLLNGQRASTVVHFLEKFKNTLTELDMEKVTLYGAREFTTYLNLPKLKKLSVQISSMFHQLDCLLPLESLEDLKIFCNFYSGRRDGLNKEKIRSMFFQPDQTEKIKFKGFLNKMGQSNIAKVFPFLNHLEIHNLNQNDGKIIRYRRKKKPMH